MKALVKYIIIGLLLAWKPFVNAVEIIHYANKPVTIYLKKDQERTLHFGDHVQVGVSQGLVSRNLFRLQSAQGALHILPYEAFDKKRIQVKRISDNHIVLLDLISEDKNGSPLEDVKIVMSFEDTRERANVPSDETRDTPFNQVITPIELSRYASQRLYGPTRLHKEVMGISSSVIPNKAPVRIFKVNDIHVESKVIYAVEGGGYYLAAIHIKNISDKSVQLDYLDINVPFSHATFQHHKLGRRNSTTDNTILYLINNESMKKTLYPYDYYHPKSRTAEADQ